MKYYIITCLSFYLSIYSLSAQNKPICAVKYKDYRTNLGTYNYWFFHDRLIGINETNFKAQFANGFPVIVNGAMRTETDTVKYRKEFEEFITDIKTQMSKYPQDVKLKFYQSDILSTSITVKGTQKNFIVIDTLQQLGKWEITKEMSTIMGYKCQKANIEYNGERYSAWFAPDLPYNAGPEIFRGLPGLILKVSNENGYVGYEAIELLIPYKGVIPEFNNTGNTIIRKDWVVFINDYNKKEREARKNQLEQEKREKVKEN